MRRIDDTYRVFGLVGLAVASGLAVAGFANGSADAHGGMASVVRPVTRAPAEGADAPARKVRVVYSGPFGAPARDGRGRAVQETEKPVRSAISQRHSDEPSVTGSTAPAPAAIPLQVASRQTAAAPIGALPQAIDLNRASVAELNALGSGRIGKAIARGRPYASPEDLLKKRIVNRATFARIRDQVTVE